MLLNYHSLEFECEKGQLFNIRGKCVSEREQLIRIARPYAHTFRSGLNDTKPIKKCSEEPAYGKISYLILCQYDKINYN